MKLLFVLPEWGEIAGGLATYYRQLVPQLRLLGHQVDVRVGSPFMLSASQPAEAGVSWLTPEGLEKHLHRFRHLAPLANLDRHLAAAWALRDMGPFEQYDVVECCDWGLAFLPWVQSNARVAVRLHASLGQIARHEALPGQAAFQTTATLLEQAGLARADALATYSQANADDWRRRLGTDVVLQRPPYETPPRETGAVTRGVGGGIVSGKIQRWKGVETLCEAMEQVQGLDLDWFGNDMPTQIDGKRISMSASLAVRFPAVWGRRLKPRGVVSPRQLAAIRRSAAFVIVPSSWDVFNFTVVEAMADGLPVIVSTGAGASELIEHEKSGLLFEAGNTAQLVQCLKQFKSLTAGQRSAMGMAGRATVKQQLDPPRVASEHADFLQQVASRPMGQRDPGFIEQALSCPEPVRGGDDVLENYAGKALLRALGQRTLTRLRRLW